MAGFERLRDRTLDRLTNGLEVNGRPTRTAALLPGDVLTVGRAVTAVVR